VGKTQEQNMLVHSRNSEKVYKIDKSTKEQESKEPV